MSSAVPDPTDPLAEWTARYAGYLERATSRAGRTAALNQQLLQRIARGHVVPATVQSHLSAFLAGNAADYANELAETSMQFFTGLIGAGTRYSFELVERIVPGQTPEIDRPRPEFDPDDWGNWFQRLTDYASAENATVTAMLRVVMDKVASGDLAPLDMQSVSEDYHDEQLPGSVAELVNLYFGLLSRLDDAHASFGDRFLETVLGATADTERSEATLDLVGPGGGSATARFAVANDANEPTSLRAVMTDVRRADGIGPAFEPDVTISPERFVLARGAEEVLELTVRLTPDRFDPGPEYVGTLHVLSPGRTLVEVPVRIRAAHASEPDPA